MRKFLLVPVLGLCGLAAVSVSYAMVGVFLSVLLLAILAIPMVVAFKRFSVTRSARLQTHRSIW
jgi:ABC-type nickel/cobalt efflux system permease component RcnA